MKMIVIGGSSGAHQPLATILRDLPADLDAAVLVLRHSWPASPSVLAQVLRPHATMPVEEIEDGCTVRKGHVYVTPSGTNVTFEAGSGGGDGDAFAFRLSPCPPALRGRPNIDIALISAAETFGDDCIGVVLSGYLDDGTIGAIEIDEYEGTMIAQAPSDAEQPSMPLNVIRRDSPDYILPDILIGGTLRDLVAGRLPEQRAEIEEASLVDAS